MGRGGGCLFAGDLEEVGGLDLTFWRLRWVRRVGVGVAVGVGRGVAVAVGIRVAVGVSVGVGCVATATGEILDEA